MQSVPQVTSSATSLTNSSEKYTAQHYVAPAIEPVTFLATERIMRVMFPDQSEHWLSAAAAAELKRAWQAEFQARVLKENLNDFWATQQAEMQELVLRSRKQEKRIEELLQAIATLRSEKTDGRKSSALERDADRQRGSFPRHVRFKLLRAVKPVRWLNTTVALNTKPASADVSLDHETVSAKSARSAANGDYSGRYTLDDPSSKLRFTASFRRLDDAAVPEASLFWFRAIRPAWKTYQDFKDTALKTHSKTKRNRRSLIVEAQLRTQGEDEPRRLKRCKDNLINFQELLERAQEAEDDEVGQWRPPPPAEQSMLPEAAYKPKSRAAKIKPAGIASVSDQAAEPNWEKCLREFLEQKLKSANGAKAQTSSARSQSAVVKPEQGTQVAAKANAGATPRGSPGGGRGEKGGGRNGRSGGNQAQIITPKSDKNKDKEIGPSGDKVPCWNCCWPGHSRFTCPECSAKLAEPKNETGSA
ncbi:uncharacterized protein LOC131663395 [Phymastichus coffea]|uniref:uncharacterized protein LOC131663395 n=1 Tax=Phymastichus coffea TaxID=108790 RepID=UPI00273BBB97|nr:uncharacterized protein LOC131663395 [Phymastichus coffea]